MIEIRTFRVDNPATSRIRVDRSVFIGEIFPLTISHTKVDEILHGARKRYPDASHQPYAYRIIVSGDDVEYCSDDGEPSGTAGRPILDRLRDRHILNAMLLVTRYFGGRKLGKRRLREVFSESAEMTIEAANLVRVYPASSVTVRFPFGLTGAVNSIVRKFDGKIVGQEYTERVRLDVLFRREIVLSAVRHLAGVIKDRGEIDLDEAETLVDA